MENDVTQRMQEAGWEHPLPTTSLRSVLEGVEARTHATYEVMYGINSDSGDFVMHFYPPGYALDNSVLWGEAAWNAFHDKLEGAIMEFFAVQVADKKLSAGWVSEVQSFYVISEKPRAVDFAAWLNAFFGRLESGRDTD